MYQKNIAKIFKLKVFGKSPINAYLRVNQRIWNRLPALAIKLDPVISYGDFLNFLARLSAIRKQNSSTYFFRNRAELELIRHLSNQKPKGSELKIMILACSNGAEVYSILWTIRSGRPDLRLMTNAVDISREALKFAEKGVYSKRNNEPENVSIFERLTKAEMQEIFDQEGDTVKVKTWFKEGINWHLGDAGDPQIIDILGPHDIVVGNRFLCHMDPPDAERCLRNIASMVKPGGYLFVSGIDLDVRTRVARDLGWEPMQDMIKEIHNGDPSLRDSWPCGYWGLEPFNIRRKDWKMRYASAFRLNEKY